MPSLPSHEKIAEEKHERIKGDESTLNAAKSFTSSREVVINNRTDRVVAEAGNKVLQKANNYTDWRVNGLEQSMTNYTNERFAQLKNEVDRNKKRADAGILSDTDWRSLSCATLTASVSFVPAAKLVT